MVAPVNYPTPEQIIDYNTLALAIIKVKRADQPKVINKYGIMHALEICRSKEGDVYDKAACLLKELIQRHPFASGNRRTAFIVTKEFILSNNLQIQIKDDPSHARVMQGIRENYFTDEEIKEWLKNGKIREFKR